MIHPTSFENVKHRWKPEIDHHAPGVPFLLVGTKLDLTTDMTTVSKLRSKRLTPISQLQADTLKEGVGAEKSIVCSALTQHGLKQVFEEAIRTALTKKEERLYHAVDNDMSVATCVFL